MVYLKIFEMEESSNDYDLNLKSNDMSEHIRLSLDDSGHNESQNLDNSTIENVKKNILKYKEAIK